MIFIQCYYLVSSIQPEQMTPSMGQAAQMTTAVMTTIRNPEVLWITWSTTKTVTVVSHACKRKELCFYDLSAVRNVVKLKKNHIKKGGFIILH